MLVAAENYARNGVDTVFKDRFMRSIWINVKADLDADDTAYEEKRAKNQIKGWTSDFKRNYAPAHGIDPDDKEALETYIQQRLTAVDSN